MLAMTLVVVLAQADAPAAASTPAPAEAPTVSDAPLVPGPPIPSAPVTPSFIDPERAKLNYELSQLERERPRLGFSIAMMSGGTTVFALALFFGLTFGLGIVPVVAFLGGVALAAVGVVTFIIGATHIGDIDRQIAEKRAAIRALEAKPQPGVLAPAM